MSEEINENEHEEELTNLKIKKKFLIMITILLKLLPKLQECTRSGF